MSGELRLASGECLGDATDKPSGPLSQLWERTGDEVTYKLGDPADDREQRAWREANSPPPTPTADVETRREREFNARALAAGWSGEERDLRRRAQERAHAIMRELNHA